jgi:hypothetical protein
MRRRLLAFCAIFLSFSFAGAERVVKIESARTSEYVKSESVATDGQEETKPENEVIRFRGDVLISVTDGGSVSSIGADEIIYDKTQDTLEARGNVTYKHTSGKSGTEEFRGDALLFNIEKQEGIFLDGIVTQDTGDKKSDPYVIHAEVSGRNAGTTMAFKNGILTTCDADEPHWSINASRIWLLPGNEIALLNGVFYIGPLPVFYLPFFYYPSDEMIFHPVFGYRTREGNFIQTSTYLFGRKPLASTATSASSSANKDKKTFSNFLQNSTLKKQEPNGLFLMNLEEDAQDVSGNYLKVLGDAYSNLGYMAGIDGNFSSGKLIKSFSGSAYLGFSKTLYPLSSGSFYTTFDSYGKENWNSSSFFGLSVPFRYRFNFSVQIDKSPLQFTLAMPFVSDKTFKTDFLDRSEDLNWFDTLTKSGKTEEDTVTAETSYSWTASGSFSPDVSFAKPWLTSLSVSGLSASMTFNSKQNTSYTGEEATYAPDNYFFYPEILKPEIKLSLGGTLLSSEKAKASTSDSKKAIELGALTNPFAQDKQEEKKKDGVANENPSDSVGSIPIPAAGIGVQANAVNSRKFAYSLTWSLQPTYVQELRYDTTLWAKPSDIKWNQFSSVYYQIKGIAALNGSFSYDSNLFSITTALNFTGTKQDHPLLTGASYSTATQRETVFTSDYKASIFEVKTTDAVKFAPLIHNELLKPFSLTWNYTGILLKNEFSGTIAKPEWKVRTPEWTDDFVSVHNAALVTGVSLGGLDQTITITSNLPPLQESYAGSGSFNWGFGSLSMSTKLYDQNTSDEVKDWVWEPFKTTLSWKLLWGITLGQEFSYSINDNEPAKLGLTAGWGFFSAYYTISNSVPYTLVSGSGWVLDAAGAKFIPSAIGCSFSNSSKPLQVYLWKDRIALTATLTTNLKFNLLQITDSSFIFTPAITIKVLDFLDITFSTNSTNEVIARYMQGMLNLPMTLPGETNPFVDLAKSFNFASTEDRKQSGFKIKKLNVSVSHYLHDWTMIFKTSLEPKLKTSGGYRYEFLPNISFVVQWKPITDIKTKVRSKEGVFAVNPSDEDTDD